MPWRRSAVAFVLLLEVACNKGRDPLHRVAIELRVRGDDSLTVGFMNAVNQKLAASPEVVVSSGLRPGSIVIEIPTNVQWKHIEGRTQIGYLVRFESSDGHALGDSAGECWEEALPACAERVVAEALTVARRHGG